MRWVRAASWVLCAGVLGAACGGSVSEGLSSDAGGGGVAGGGGEPADAPAGDAPAGDAPTTDATQGPTPGTVHCGTATCPTPSQVCCPNLDGGVCAPAGATPQNCEPVACDQAADCPAGLVCCFVGHHGCSLGSTCATSCGDTDYGTQLCASDAECSTGACTPRLCGGASVGTCQAGYCCS